MTDKIELLGNSLIQHGKESDRIYLIKLSEEDCPNIIGAMENLAHNRSYSKIFAKIPASLKPQFTNNGYVTEAYVKNFFKGREDCVFLAKYFTKERKELKNKNEIVEILKLCKSKTAALKKSELRSDFYIKFLDEEHVVQMAEIYKSVFTSYPFPIFDPEYILKTMRENIDYYGIFKNDKIIALSSSEMDLKDLNTEMTDFATLPEYRGSSLSYHLLREMERSAKAKGMKTAYTIARSKNTGMNMAFAKRFYKFGGMLINNTNICGNIETMNVWHKALK